MNINIKALAETALLERQALPPFLGAGAVRPSYDGLGLANVTALALDWLCPNATCLKGGQLPPFDPTLLGVRAVTDAWQQWQQQGAINHVVMLMMDAFGYDQLRSLVAMGDIPELATACASPQAFFMPATTTFPSTTATALTTAATAHAPAQHGAVGTMVYLPEVGSAVNLLSWRPVVAGNSSPYSDEQLNSETFLPMSNVYRRFEEYGLDTGIISLRSLQKTSLSRMMTTGSQAIEQGFMGYLTPADSFVRLRDRLSRLDHQNKSFTYCYVPNLDAAAHKYGPLSHNYRAEAAVLDFALKRELLQPLKGKSDVVLLLVADHGQVRTHPDKVLWLNHHPELIKHLFVPVLGDPRARFLYVKHGREAAVLDYVKQNLSENCVPLAKEEAIALGLFGLPEQPPSEAVRDRMGDLILLPRNGWFCPHYTGQTKLPESLPVAGVHGGISRAEMLIPFLAYRF